MTTKIDIMFAKLLAIESNLKYSGIKTEGKIEELSWILYKCYSVHYYKPQKKFEIEQVEPNAYITNMYTIINNSKELIPDTWAQHLFNQILIELNLLLYKIKYDNKLYF